MILSRIASIIMVLIVTFFTYVITYTEIRAMQPSSAIIGLEFPRLEAETLSGGKVAYPDSVKGSVTLILIAFERQTQGKIDTWLNPFVERFGNTPGIKYYEIPMIKRRWIVISPIIDGGMRSGLPEAKHNHVTTYYGNVDTYAKLLSIRDKSDCYVYLLDPDAKIRWHISGAATPEKITELFEKTGELLKAAK